MTVERIVNEMVAQPAPDTLTSGSWSLVADSSRSLVVEQGVRAELLVIDAEAAVSIDINVAQGAELRMVYVSQTQSANHIKLTVAEGGRCDVTQVMTHSSEVHFNTMLDGRFATFELNGVFVLTGDDRGGVTVDVHHNMPDCTSCTIVKGVASGSAHGRFSGVVYVAPDAQRTDSKQLSRNVTLGDARIETLPQLEIYADDVKCSHGATVGQMDAEAVMYMRQRGLSLVDAKRLQLEGFVSDVVMRSALGRIAEPLQELISEKINRL